MSRTRGWVCGKWSARKRIYKDGIPVDEPGGGDKLGEGSVTHTHFPELIRGGIGSRNSCGVEPELYRTSHFCRAAAPAPGKRVRTLKLLGSPTFNCDNAPRPTDGERVIVVAGRETSAQSCVDLYIRGAKDFAQLTRVYPRLY